MNITKAINLKVKGISGHCKATYDITTGKFYARQSDAAKAIGVTSSTLSTAMTNKVACRGHRCCFVSEMPKYLDEIAVANKALADKARKYDAMIARKEAIKKLEADIEKHKANSNLHYQAYEKDRALMEEATKRLKELTANEEEVI